ncbi:MAG: deaminated glutathione amidase [Candidatus Schmidhempelia sp.]|nr:deaminated glutathione amidase [Candidatus Schmidhempelia sp.]
MFKVALGQFAVSRIWQDNLHTSMTLMQQAETAKAQLLVLPEGILARDINDPDLNCKQAQPLDGPFVNELLKVSQSMALTTIMTIHTPASGGLTYNTLVAIHQGKIVAKYRKLHLYDAFMDKESEKVMAGEQVPPLLDIGGVKLGLMICYDLRFPELARRLVLDGADVLVLSAAWVRGSLKESHWEILLRARALENTAYIIGVNECGVRNIGCSMVVDPLGVIVAQAAEEPNLIFADIDQKRIAHVRQILPVLKNTRFDKPELV